MTHYPPYPDIRIVRASREAEDQHDLYIGHTSINGRAVIGSVREESSARVEDVYLLVSRLLYAGVIIRSLKLTEVQRQDLWLYTGQDETLLGHPVQLRP